VRLHGTTFAQFACLSKHHGLDTTAKRFDQSHMQEFEELVDLCTRSSFMHLVTSFSRKALGQTGDGHFSPIGAYNANRKMVLILDVARFKAHSS
jgi:glutathione gamma-glutamylcysteinyltransferase